MTSAAQLHYNRATKDWRNYRIGDITILRLKRTQLDQADPRWTCHCACGATRDIPFSRLESGRVTHCGDPARHPPKNFSRRK